MFVPAPVFHPGLRHPPYLTQQLGPAAHPLPVPLQQRLQQRELRRRQFHSRPACVTLRPARSISRSPNRSTRSPELPRCRRPSAFTRARSSWNENGFPTTSSAPEFQTLHPLLHPRPPGQHQHRGRTEALAHLRQHLQPVLPRQAQVQDHQLRPQLRRRTPALSRHPNHRDLVAIQPQSPAQKMSQRRIVLHNQHRIRRPYIILRTLLSASRFILFSMVRR